MSELARGLSRSSGASFFSCRVLHHVGGFVLAFPAVSFVRHVKHMCLGLRTDKLRFRTGQVSLTAWTGSRGRGCHSMAEQRYFDTEQQLSRQTAPTPQKHGKTFHRVLSIGATSAHHSRRKNWLDCPSGWDFLQHSE